MCTYGKWPMSRKFSMARGAETLTPIVPALTLRRLGSEYSGMGKISAGGLPSEVQTQP